MDVTGTSAQSYTELRRSNGLRFQKTTPTDDATPNIQYVVKSVHTHLWCTGTDDHLARHDDIMPQRYISAAASRRLTILDKNTHNTGKK